MLSQNLWFYGVNVCSGTVVDVGDRDAEFDENDLIAILEIFKNIWLGVY